MALVNWFRKQRVAFVVKSIVSGNMKRLKGAYGPDFAVSDVGLCNGNNIFFTVTEFQT